MGKGNLRTMGGIQMLGRRRMKKRRGVVTNYEIASTFICKSKKNFIKSEIISF